MPGMEAFRIDLKEINRKDYPRVLSLDDSFFASLDQDEILGGNVEVMLNAREKADGVYQLKYTLAGTVKVQCDRCLGKMEISVEAGNEVGLCHEDSDRGAADAGDGNDVNVIPPGTRYYDVSWDIYETIVLSLPIQRVHEERQCDESMLEQLNRHIRTEE